MNEREYLASVQAITADMRRLESLLDDCPVDVLPLNKRQRDFVLGLMQAEASAARAVWPERESDLAWLAQEIADEKERTRQKIERRGDGGHISNPWCDRLERINAVLYSSAGKEYSAQCLLAWLYDERLGLDYITADGHCDGAPKRRYFAVENVTPDLYRVTPEEAIRAAMERADPALLRACRDEDFEEEFLHGELAELEAEYEEHEAEANLPPSATGEDPRI